MAANALATLDDPEAVVIPAGITDLRGFRDWAHSDDFPERGRISYLRGEILVDMSPEEIDSHNKVVFEVAYGIGAVAKANDLGEVLGESVLFINSEADVSTEPDLIFCTWETLESGRAAYREYVEGSGRYVEIAGSPDLVVEVISRSSVRKDTKVLFEGYFDAGVREYWLIDARGKEIDFRIHRRGRAKFQRIKPDSEGYVPSPVLGRAFRLIRDRNRIGGWRYDLESR
ncbi:MAG: Uma2 family endonuclease [Planctomycetaceae bacterium]